MSFDILNKTKNPTPQIKFLLLKNKFLGPKYELSLVFCGDYLAQKLNQKYRKKEYIPEILSFPLTEQMGEIFINLKIAEKKRLGFKMSKNQFLVYLFIHGILHLKGMSHGAKMELEEKKILKYAKINNIYPQR